MISETELLGYLHTALHGGTEMLERRIKYQPQVVALNGNNGIGCNVYHVLNPHIGCKYSCSYCYNLRFGPVKWDLRILSDASQIKTQLQESFRLLRQETAYYFGQFQDALAIDHITKISRVLVPIFAKDRYARLVMATKSDNIANLLGLDHRYHTAIVWSLNPEPIIRLFERGTPNLERRIKAACNCQTRNYLIRFQFSPIIPLPSWQRWYREMIEQALACIKPQRITIACLSCFPQVLKQLETGTEAEKEVAALFEGRDIDHDGRIRLPEELRISIYKFIIDEIRKWRPSVKIALCLETPEIHSAIGTSPREKCNCVW